MDYSYNFDIDSRFIEYFDGNLKQVFLYLVDECQLNCVQCLYKLENNFNMGRKQIDESQALAMIEDFYKLGARKLTLMGGEPTLYDRKNERRAFFNIIERAKELGYEYVRIDTNGQFESELLDNSSMKKLDEITFSVDGPRAEINDPLRGKGSFEKVAKNIKYAVKCGYNVNVTSCIHRGLIQRNEKGELFIEEMIDFIYSLGVSRLNFHDLFKGGIPRDYWTDNLDISVDEWFDVWTELQKNIENKKYPIPIRIPQSFINSEEFEKNKEYYGYCSVKTADRILVHPNGIMRVCSLMIGTPYGIATYYDNKITWNDGYTNEACAHEMDKCTACTNQSKSKSYGNFLPLCVSFKPKQNEFVWQLKLEWEERIKDEGCCS